MNPEGIVRAGAAQSPLKLTYEELMADQAPVRHRVLDHLGIPAPDPRRRRHPHLSVQPDKPFEGGFAASTRT